MANSAPASPAEKSSSLPQLGDENPTTTIGRPERSSLYNLGFHGLCVIVTSKMNLPTNNYQRLGAISNAHAGRDFEEAARLYFATTGIHLTRNFSLPVGFTKKKNHKFDLGSEHPPILVECKSQTWTVGNNEPSAKIRAMNEVMLLFSVCPVRYRRILFILKHLRNEVSLGTHYIRRYGHLIGPQIEVWEFDLAASVAERLI
jgi:hypothetical protein